jgi:hypothetical protein
MVKVAVNKYGKIWEKVTPSRYRRSAEIYMALPFGGGSQRVQGRIKGYRSGPTNAAPVAARALERAGQTEEQPAAPPAPTPDKGGALAAIAKGIGTVIEWEKQLTSVVGKIPFPKVTALTVGDFSLGLPHGHMHPPNLIPPSTVPIPIPGAGPVLKIPYLSGADNTKHGGKNAAMCGDMGAAAWCGGYVPMFEIFFGSAHVWIENNRAARVCCDIVEHCTFSSPKPSDPPLGPMVGASTGGVAHVGIGGFPLPSFFSMAVGKAFQAVAHFGGKAFRKATAKSFVDKLTRVPPAPGKPVIEFNGMSDPEILRIEKDLYKIASTRTGRHNLNRVAKAFDKNGFNLTFSKYPPDKHGNVDYNASGWTKGGLNAAGYRDFTTGKPGPGFDAEIKINPLDWPNSAHPRTPSDALTNHELNHAANAMEGKLSNHAAANKHGWGSGQNNVGRWSDYEEFETTHVDNAYRRDMGYKQRKDYGSPMP